MNPESNLQLPTALGEKHRFYALYSDPDRDVIGFRLIGTGPLTIDEARAQMIDGADCADGGADLLVISEDTVDGWIEMIEANQSPSTYFLMEIEGDPVASIVTGRMGIQLLPDCHDKQDAWFKSRGRSCFEECWVEMVIPAAGMSGIFNKIRQN